MSRENNTPSGENNGSAFSRRSLFLFASSAAVGVLGLTACAPLGGGQAPGPRSSDGDDPRPSPSWTPVVDEPSDENPTISDLVVSAPGSSMLSIWAHPDDDIIFANPKLLTSIHAGVSHRTVFLTAGDAGKGEAYAKSRREGILRAYNVMRNSTALWQKSLVRLASGAVLTQYVPEDSQTASVLFFNIPDGNINGAGFARTGNISMRMVLLDKRPAIRPIDGSPALSLDMIESSLAELIQAIAPSQLITHIPGIATRYWHGDHPDHNVVGTFTRRAAQKSGFSLTQLSYAIGYPTSTLPSNVFGEPLHEKMTVYRSYTAFDPVVFCATDASCLHHRGFGAWLSRQYLQSDAELFPDGKELPLSAAAGNTAIIQGEG